MTVRNLMLEIRDAQTGRCYGSRLVRATFDDEMKDAEGFGFVSRELWKDAKRALDQGEPRCHAERCDCAEHMRNSLRPHGCEHFYRDGEGAKK